MTSIAVVASAHDAKFAEEVRAALQAAGLDASVSQSLPKAASPHVVLIWSATLEASHAIDAQALIGLWSEDRLLVARRDATPLPLGLRDLPSQGPDANSKEVAAAARAMNADRPVAPELKQLSRRYEIVRAIGKGSMGIVYEGMDPRLHRKVAIKTILKGHMDDDEVAKEYSMRFKREAQAVARLNHPHIVQVYDFGEEAEVAYIVMEFISGKDLKSYFDAKIRFELKEVVRIMCELLDALDFAHEAGIVHRDVKPANVMLDGQARVKLADFGVARVADDRSAKDKAQAGIMFGGMVFMSPEQITGGIVDRRSDIFLAGIILYEFLTGEKPFTGPGAWSIAKKIIQDHPPVPSSINNTISPLFDNVVNKALSKTVDGRYQTAKEFASALKRALEGKFDEDEPDKTVVGSMGDLPQPAKPAAQTAGAMAAVTKGTAGAGSQEVELEFWRAIKDGSDPDDFELYVQQFPTGIYAALAKRKLAKLRGTGPVDPNAAELEKREVERATKRETEVRQKLAEEKAKLETQLAAKEAEFKKREAGAPKATLPVGWIISVFVAIGLVGGGGWYYFSKSSIERQASKAPEPVAKPAPVTKAEAPRKTEVVAAAPKAEAKSAPVPMSRSQRERMEDEAAAHKAIATAKSAKSNAPDVAASAPSAKGPGDAYETLYEQARTLEQEGKGAEAIRLYRRAARAGSGKAAKRLGEIYDKGIPGISRDYAESLQWYETARQLGESIAIAGRGGGGPVVAPTPAPAPPPAPAALPEVPKAAAPAPTPGPAEPAAEPVAQAPEAKSGWLSARGWLIALLVLAFIYWRRSRRRARATQPQPQSAAFDSSTAQAVVLVAALSESTNLDRSAIDECVRIMRERTEAAKGRVIKTMGDEVMSVFPTADAAADAAIEMQSAIADLKPVGNTKIGIRIGFSCGSLSVQSDGEVAGDAVDVATRLSHVAVKGQIITARDTVMLMSPMLKSATRKITAIQIKGKAAEVEVYELMWQQSEDATTMAAARSVYKPKKTQLRLVLRGKEHVLGDDVTAVSMGREAAADLVITDHMASLTHGKIERRLDKFVLTDHSANGTFVTVDGDQEIVLRREEFTLRGKGWIALGKSRTAAAEVVEFYTEDLRTDPKPDATLFVSYSHKDRSRVEPIVSVIEEMGRRVWMDRSDITGQTGWAGQIVRAIRECRAVVLMASPNSYTSDQVVRELYLAMNHKKTIVPIEIEPAEMPDELQYILAPFQHHRLSGRETREVIGRALAAV